MTRIWIGQKATTASCTKCFGSARRLRIAFRSGLLTQKRREDACALQKSRDCGTKHNGRIFAQAPKPFMREITKLHDKATRYNGSGGFYAATSTINALRTPMNREQTAHATANQTDSSTLKRRCCSGGLSLAKQRERFSAFTLAELVLSMGALVLLVLLTSQLLDSAATIMTLGHRQMNADSAARELFDRIAIDFAQMVKRSDVDYYLKSSTTASDCTLCTRQRGNDQIAFYSTVPGWSALAGAQQSPVSIVGYRIHVSADTFSNRMERLGEGLIWNGATSDRRGDGRPASVNFGAPLNPWANASNTPFDVISPDVFRFEYYYVLKNGDLSSTPWYTISSVRGMQDVSAIIVDIAVLDPKSRVLLTNSDITALAQELPDYGGQVPGGLLAGWRTALDANRTLPHPALSSVRLYERCFHLCPTGL
jgi:hypothetical protein